MSGTDNRLAASPAWQFIVILGVTAAISPLGMSIHVQSIPAIATDLRTSYASAQLTVSLYLFTFAAVQLVVGPLSDRLGRRPVLFGGLAIFAGASFAAAMAPTIEVMLAARMLQAAGGCAALVTPRAVIQDRLSGVEAARMLGLVSILQSSAPIAAPIIGGILDAVFGWHAVFLFLGLYGVAIIAVTAARLPESRPMEDGKVASWGTILSRYRNLLSSRRYLAYMAVYACGTTGYFGFLTNGPAVLIGDLGLTPWQFSLILATICIQFVISGYLASRLVLRFGIDRILIAGGAMQVASVLAFWVIAQAPDAIGVTITMCAFTFSNGLLFANALAGATAVDPRIAGSAASLLGSLQFGLGGIVAITVAALPMTNFGPYPLILLLLAVGALAGALVAFRLSRDQALRR